MLSPSIHSAFRKGHINIQLFTAKGGWSNEDDIENPNATEAKMNNKHDIAISILKANYWMSLLRKYWTGRLGPEEYLDIAFSDGTPLKNSINTFTLRTKDPEKYP